MNDIKKYILNNDITFIVTSPNTRTLSIINLLNELSIKDNYKTTLFSLNISSNYYLQKLISFLSSINSNLIAKYLYPCSTISKQNKDKINHNKFLNSIEKIQNSNILINSEKYVGNKDYLDYILDFSESNVLIVDNIYTLLDETKYSLDEIKTKINKKKDVHLVIFIRTRYKGKAILKFNNKISKYIFIDGRNYIDYKDININILNKTIKLKLNKLNQIMEETNEG